MLESPGAQSVLKYFSKSQHAILLYCFPILHHRESDALASPILGTDGFAPNHDSSKRFHCNDHAADDAGDPRLVFQGIYATRERTQQSSAMICLAGFLLNSARSATSTEYALSQRYCVFDLARQWAE